MSSLPDSGERWQAGREPGPGESASSFEPREYTVPVREVIVVDVPDGDATGAAASGDETALEIRDDIEQTRAELTVTIDAIQERLAPEKLVDRAKEAAREAATEAADTAREAVREATIGKAEHMVSDVAYTARDVRAGLMDSIRENPLPAAMAGLGLAWLFMSSRRGGQHTTNPPRYLPPAYAAYGTDYRNVDTDTGSGVGGAVGRLGDRASQVVGGAGDVVGSAGDRASQVVGSASDRATGMASQARDTVQQVASTAADRAADVTDSAQETWGRAQGQLDRTLYETPLAVGAVALGIGAAIGFMLPGTPAESRLMGDARDTMLERAQDTLQQTTQKVGRVAESVQQAATQEAQSQHLTA